MPYIHPDEVTQPRNHWQMDCVICDEGEGRISVSLGRWDGNQVIGIRWNGTENSRLGNPQSSANPTWFILPRELGVAVVKDLIIKQAAGSPSIRPEGLRSAVNWLRETGAVANQME
jgi:hypothetical protein